ncbi:MAG: tRNA-dihydrouridine synthase, partial [Gemmataceae bacterium]
TRAQGFGGRVNLDGIRSVVEAVERIPILGNGDVRTIADAAEMRRLTGCAGVAIGRGALLNPWIFAQLACWETSGEAAAPATYLQRLEFMDRHFHLLVEHRGEHFACLTFRKVANWYCRVLRPGHDLQQRLMKIDGVDGFEQIVEEIRDLLDRRSGQAWPDADLPLRVPSGPVERW